MKSLLAILGFIIVSGISAKAVAQQRKDCGNNLKQVQQIIDENPKWDLSPTHTKKFIGSWGEGGKIKIEQHGNFTYDTHSFQVCPKEDGTFVLVNKDYPSYTGFLRMKNGKVEIYGFSGMAAHANNTYSRASGNAVASGGRNY